MLGAFVFVISGSITVIATVALNLILHKILKVVNSDSPRKRVERYDITTPVKYIELMIMYRSIEPNGKLPIAFLCWGLTFTLSAMCFLQSIFTSHWISGRDLSDLIPK